MEPTFLPIEDLPQEIALAIGKSDGIWCLGNTKLMERRGLSFCGSRKSSQKGIDTARQCAQQAVAHDLVCVSGNAAGIDLNIHSAALESGGTTIFVLPEGIDHFSIRQHLKPHWNWENCLVISQYPKNARWQVWRAMERNKLIIALGIALIVIEAADTGGTQQAAQQALDIGKPLFAVNYRAPVSGNQAIAERGAKNLGLDSQTMLPNIQKVIDISVTSYGEQQKGQMDLPLL